MEPMTNDELLYRLCVDRGLSMTKNKKRMSLDIDRINFEKEMNRLINDCDNVGAYIVEPSKIKQLSAERQKTIHETNMKSGVNKLFINKSTD